MARALARGWGEPVLARDAGSGPRRGAGRGAGRRGASAPTPSWPSAPTSSCSPTSPRSSRRSAARGRRGRARRRLAPRRRPRSTRAARRLPGHAGRARACPTRRSRSRRGVVAARRRAPPTSRSAGAVEELFGARRRRSSRCPRALMDAATALLGRRARLLGAGRRGADRRRRPPRLPRRGAAELVDRDDGRHRRAARARGNDTLAVRREVTSPGGSTARGLAALERGGLRAAFDAAAMDDGALGPRPDGTRASRSPTSSTR